MDIIQTFNPANANITADELNAMKDLTDEDIDKLAKAYPNTPNGNAYLVYYNTSNDIKTQLYPLGTWANLRALRKLGIKNILPYSFRDKFYPKKAVANAHRVIPSRVVDLSHQEIKEAEGLKKGEASTSGLVFSDGMIRAAAVEATNAVTAPGATTIGGITAAAGEGTGTVVTNTPATDGPHVPVIDPKLTDLQKQLQQAKDDKAHHMIIKKLEKDIDAHINNTAKYSSDSSPGP